MAKKAKAENKRTGTIQEKDGEAENQKTEAIQEKDGKANPNILEGAKAICNFIQRSEPTLMRLIKQEDLPKKGVIYKRGGIWVANRERLKKWWIAYLENWQKSS